MLGRRLLAGARTYSSSAAVAAEFKHVGVVGLVRVYKFLLSIGLFSYHFVCSIIIHYRV